MSRGAASTSKDFSGKVLQALSIRNGTQNLRNDATNQLVAKVGGLKRHRKIPQTGEQKDKDRMTGKKQKEKSNRQIQEKEDRLIKNIKKDRRG